jgi:tetratricopeptide (TPR) repeat protein
MILQHLDRNIMSGYLSAELPEHERAYCQAHLIECNDCRGELALLVRILDEEVSPEELAILNRVETARAERHTVSVQPPSLYERFCQSIAAGWKLAVVSTSIVLIVAATFILLLKNNISDISRQSAASVRTLEARLSSQPYSQFVQTRTAPAIGNPAPGNDELKRLGANPFEMGRFYLQHNEFAKAIAQLEEAKKQEPNSVEISNDLGIAYMESALDGSLDKAVGQFKEALRLKPKYEPAVFNLALACERLGHFSEAEEDFSLYLQMDPDSGWAKEVKSKLQLWKH